MEPAIGDLISRVLPMAAAALSVLLAAWVLALHVALRRTRSQVRDLKGRVRLLENAEERRTFERIRTSAPAQTPATTGATGA